MVIGMCSEYKCAHASVIYEKYIKITKCIHILDILLSHACKLTWPLNMADFVDMAYSTYELCVTDVSNVRSPYFNHNFRGTSRNL
jgi:hypothetical protein